MRDHKKKHQEVTTVEGTILNKEDSKKFHEALGIPEIFRALTKPALVKQDGDAYHLTLYIKANATDVIRHAFKGGALRHWRDRFKIKSAV